ncbi:MAG TPA: hypothetical protein DD405_02400 [Desulfobacteraceae bacterium]|nr:hypothetical protein [Desulfobacteraceae bacterium]
MQNVLCSQNNALLHNSANIGLRFGKSCSFIKSKLQRSEGAYNNGMERDWKKAGRLFLFFQIVQK